MQPVLAGEGKPTVDIDKLSGVIEGCGRLEEMIPIQSPDHWAQVIGHLGAGIDAILPVSIPAYPTEIWDSHPRPLIDRGLPVIFWPLIDTDEPDFRRWSARDFLRALGVENMSREHTVIVYGDHIEDLQVLGGILGMTCKVF